MGRKSNYINSINSKDIRLMKCFQASQHMEKNQILKVISNHRLQNFVKQKVLEKIHYVKSGYSAEVYALTKYGERWITKNILQQNEPRDHYYFYKSTTAIAHNIKLADTYLSCTANGNYWLNERELRDYFERHWEHNEDIELIKMLEEGQISITDGASINEEGQMTLIEIYTDNYSKESLMAKEQFSIATGYPINYIKQ